jgi:phosphoribosyl-ATP pyrophosphohydrolase
MSCVAKLVHNCIAHPIAGLLWAIGAKRLGDRVHGSEGAEVEFWAEVIRVAKERDTVDSRQIVSAAEQLGGVAATPNAVVGRLAATVAQSSDPMQDFWDELSAWSQAAIAPDVQRGPIEVLEHLKLEAAEAIESMFDDDKSATHTEIADCLICVLDAARRAGMTYDDLLSAANAKLVVNQSRKWQPPVAGKPCEHIRDSEFCDCAFVTISGETKTCLTCQKKVI